MKMLIVIIHKYYFRSLPVLLGPEVRYDSMMSAFGGLSYYCTKPEDIAKNLAEVLKQQKPALLNVIIDPYAARKPQKYSWLTTSKM